MGVMEAKMVDSMLEQTGFDVIAAFSQLEVSRKMVLFDQLLGHRESIYRDTMKNFWPEATDEDAQKLSRMLHARINRLKPVS